jgi:UDPglucose--hexose-1-phosphate uridylyltransferase
VSELRWNPLLGEWLVAASARQERVFRPPDDACLFCSPLPGGPPGEVPDVTYDIAVFENRFSSLSPDPPAPSIDGTALYQVRPGQGTCEVVLYTLEHEASLANQPVEQIDRLVRVWTDRFVQLGALDFVRYVFELEAQGEATGVTLDHPHGQIYAYAFVPAQIAREIEQSRLHQDRTGRCLLCDVVAEERHSGRRIVAENASFVAYVPFFARWPYEIHIASLRHLQALPDFTREEQRDLASILKMVLVACADLFKARFAHLLALHQRPSDGQWYDYYHFHVELYPSHRTATKPNHPAGSEMGTGAFFNEALVEDTAAELRAHVAPVVWAKKPEKR